MSEIDYQLNKASDLYFYKLGQGAPILLVHGNGFDGLVWSKTAKELSKYYTVYVIDRSGFGKSESKIINTKNYNNLQAHDLQFFIVTEIKEPTIIVAWSSGALLAFKVAINDSNRFVKHLISFEAPYLTSSNSDFKAIFEFIKIIGFQLVGNKIKAAEKFLRLVLQKTNSSNSFDDLDESMQENFKRNTNSTLAEIKTRTGEDLDVQKLKNLNLQIDFIKSELSPPFIQAANERLATLFPKAKWAEIKNAGHFALYEKPVEFSKLIHTLIN
jgi:pimeloyl-ACP methyl ester carboxylesterase